MPIPEEPSFKECSSIPQNQENLKKQQSADTAKKVSLKTNPDKDEKITLKVNRNSDMIIRGKSAEVIRVASILRNAL